MIKKNNNKNNMLLNKYDFTWTDTVRVTCFLGSIHFKMKLDDLFHLYEYEYT